MQDLASSRGAFAPKNCPNPTSKSKFWITFAIWRRTLFKSTGSSSNIKSYSKFQKVVTFDSMVRFGQTFLLNGLFFEIKTMAISGSPVVLTTWLWNAGTPSRPRRIYTRWSRANQSAWSRATCSGVAALPIDDFSLIEIDPVNDRSNKNRVSNRTTCLADKCRLNRSQCGSCSTKWTWHALGAVLSRTKPIAALSTFLCGTKTRALDIRMTCLADYQTIFHAQTQALPHALPRSLPRKNTHVHACKNTHACSRIRGVEFLNSRL